MNEKVLLSYGGGGSEMNEFLKNFILKELGCESKDGLSNDAAICKGFDEFAFSTDSFVLSPIFINGADIGKIAACGSINDVLMMGAMPKYISFGLILEEGFLLDELKIILKSFAKTINEAGVELKCGDLKVVAKNNADKIYINTSCIGKANKSINPSKIKEGDVIILSGDIGRHGACVMAAREGFSYDLTSDAKCLLGEVKSILSYDVKCLRDATRGGIASVLNELANSCGYDFLINEEDIKISDGVLGLCELLGFDALELANEGTFVCIASKNDADLIKNSLNEFNQHASIIGEVKAKSKTPKVLMQTKYGGNRIISLPKGELLPRIC